MTELITAIFAATVYPEFVRINRRGSVKLSKGTHSLGLSELPLSINPDSLRASIYGAGNPRLMSVQVKRVPSPDYSSDPARNLAHEIENLQDELKRLEAKIDLIRKNKGATDPAKAEKGTIRADFGVDIQNNAVHGSDSPENAAKEIDLFFKKEEIHYGY